MIYIASDHTSIELKDKIVLYLKRLKIIMNDLGTNSTERVDYTDYASLLVRQILNTENKGILICGTGIGMSMMCNRFKNIRAALCTNEYMAKMSREHNDANILCLGSRVLGDELAKNIVSVFLGTGYKGGRHQKRLLKMDIPYV